MRIWRFYLINFLWVTEWLNPWTKYAVRWGRVRRLSVWRDIGLIAFATENINFEDEHRSKVDIDLVRAAVQTRFTLNDTGLSRAARVPSYYNTDRHLGRVRQELKIWGVNSSWIVAISAPTHAWISSRLTVTINGCAISLLEMRSGSSILIIGVDVNASAGVKRKLQRLKWTHTPRRWCWAFYGDRRNK